MASSVRLSVEPGDWSLPNVKYVAGLLRREDALTLSDRCTYVNSGGRTVIIDEETVHAFKYIMGEIEHIGAARSLGVPTSDENPLPFTDRDIQAGIREYQKAYLRAVCCQIL